MELLRLPLADAKRVVHSQTWADVRGRDDEWHDGLAAFPTGEGIGYGAFRVGFVGPAESTDK